MKLQLSYITSISGCIVSLRNIAETREEVIVMNQGKDENRLKEWNVYEVLEAKTLFNILQSVLLFLGWTVEQPASENPGGGQTVFFLPPPQG